MRNRGVFLAIVCAALGLDATPQDSTRVLTRADFGTPTIVVLPGPPSGNGDFLYGAGLEIHKWPDGQWYAVSSAWNPQYLLRYRLPATLSGTATFVGNMGTLGQESQLFGIFFDAATQRYCAHSHHIYDTDPRQQPTLACVPLDATTGKLKTILNAAGKPVPDVRRWIFADANVPCFAHAPSGTDVATNVITFAAAHGLAKGRHVIPEKLEGGLSPRAVYFAFPKSATTITLHKTYKEANSSTGTNPIDLTAPITGILTSCTPRGDRATGGGSARVPDAYAAPFRGHYIAGFGGIDSVITSGNNSMGPTACGYELPAQDDTGFVMCKPLVGYTFSSAAGMGKTFGNRDPEYAQTFHWDSNPEKGSDALAQYGAGKWTPKDTIAQTGAVIDVGGAAGFVTVADGNIGCIWYGENYHGLWPVLRESQPIVPLSTDLTTGIVTFERSVVWPTGTMVQPLTTQAGLYADPSVQFVRQVGPSAYTFHRNTDQANGADGIVPVSTDLVNNRVTFANPHGLRTQSKVRIATAGGGLAATEYYVNAAFPTTLSFHTTYADAAGTIYGQAKNPIDLTASITSLIVPPPLKLTAPITTGIRVVSYCVRATGTKASLNSEGVRHKLYIYNLADLAAVADGSKTPQSAIQPASYDAIELPGLTYPVSGTGTRRNTGAQWVPELSRYAISTRDPKGRRLWFYPVAGMVPPPKPVDLTLQEAPQ